MSKYKKLKEMLIDEEGSISHMYLDSVGKVTVGVGFMLPSPAEAKKLNFINRNTKSPANDTEIEHDFNTIQTQEKGHIASYYKEFTLLSLPQDEIDACLEKRIDEFQHGLRMKFVNYESYPEQAQKGLLDMAFNLGIEGLTYKFPNLTQAANEGDWRTCAQECHRKGISDDRNRKTKGLFDEAANA